ARGLAESMPPAALSFWRWAIALVFVLPILHVRAEPTSGLSIMQSGPLFIPGLLSICMFTILMYIAAHSTSAVNSALLQSTMPVVIPVMAILILHEAISRNQVQGILIALAGVLVILTQGRPDNLLALHFHIGDLYMIAAVLCWSLFSVLLRKFQLQISHLLQIGRASC